MACGCSKGRDNSLAGRTLKAESDLQLNEFGMYDLSEAPGCTEPYNGALPSATVYVAGRGTEVEKMFIRTQWNEASTYAMQNDVGLVHLSVKHLCSGPVLELLGA